MKRPNSIVATKEPAFQKPVGNIDLNNRPIVKNEDGSISTVRSMSFNEDGKEILIPTISDDGRVMSDNEAIQVYRQTNRYLGKFDSIEEANKYAENLHNSQEKLYSNKIPKNSIINNPIGNIDYNNLATNSINQASQSLKANKPQSLRNWIDNPEQRSFAENPAQKSNEKYHERYRICSLKRCKGNC